MDLHVHTSYSRDAVISINELINTAISKHIDVIAITDHDTIIGALKAYNLIKNKGLDRLIIIPGIEITTKYGHLLALNIYEEPKGKNIFEIIEDIHGKGGIAIAAHPFDIFAPFKNIERVSRHIDAIEYANAKTLNFNHQMRLSKLYLNKYKWIGYTAGSDSHLSDSLGDVVAVHHDTLENIDDIIDAIVNRKLIIKGKRTKIYFRLKKYFVSK